MIKLYIIIALLFLAGCNGAEYCDQCNAYRDQCGGCKPTPQQYY